MSPVQPCFAHFQAATVDDLYDALAQFRLEDDNLFTVIGTSGAAPPPPPPPRKGANGLVLPVALVVALPSAQHAFRGAAQPRRDACRSTKPMPQIPLGCCLAE